MAKKKVRQTQGNLGLLALRSAKSLGEKVNEHLLKLREERDECYTRDGEKVDTYLMPISETRFSNGEGKVKLDDSARGRDIYILADVANYSTTYTMYGKEVMMGPDEHFMDIKRSLSAISGRAKHVTVIMPLLYASRQHRKKSRESLDCAVALQDLEHLGVDEIVTFDAHDPTIQNAIPRMSFLNVYPTLDILKHFLSREKWLLDDSEKLIVISPDTGAMDRAIYYAGVLGLDVGLFYKRRDHSRIVNGKNPIVAHEYIGRDIKGMNVLIVDDMIASGQSMLDIAKELKERGAKHIFAASTFAFFTEGTEKFKEYYDKKYIDRVFSTNLNYVPEEIQNAEWFSMVDLSLFLAEIIDQLNYNHSVSRVLDATEGIREFLRENGFDPDRRTKELEG
ncbi:ribose-phosphate pyrophosphokinase [Guggenheimella bovis]